jgi:hypothetical protein
LLLFLLDIFVIGLIFIHYCSHTWLTHLIITIMCFFFFF